MEQGYSETNYLDRPNDFLIHGSNSKQIDHTLAKFHLFFLNNLCYEPINYLFDALAILLHFWYTSTKIRECIMAHIYVSLHHNDSCSLQSLQIDLAFD